MQYRSAIKGAPRSRHRTDTEYWTLVRQLMEAGWYRIGQGRDPSGASWGFRAGHTVSEPSANGRRGATFPQRESERWIEAKTETAAMRRLLRDLHVE